ncbi:MAG: YhdP family phospholipid transporter [Advenella sp.]|uniref:YhdP family phospholipid transporter n=1 Tax=Advenella sp. TaxID=1872388 RepID=UPI002685D73D
MNLPYRLLKSAGTVLIALIVLAMAAALAVRFLLAPNIDHFRQQVEQRLSAETGQHVTIGKLAIDWTGIVPRLRLRALQISDQTDTPMLAVGEAVASLDWGRAMQLQLEPAAVEIQQIHLNMTRDRQNRIWLLGRRLDSDNVHSAPEAVDAGNVTLAPLSDLLQALPEMTVLNGSFSWIDQTRPQAGPFTLSDFTLQLTKNGTKRVLSASARMPEQVGHSIQLLSSLQQDGVAGEQMPAWSGNLRVSVLKMDVLAARPWFDIPQKVKSGIVSHAVVDLQIDSNVPQNMMVAYGLEKVRVEDHIRNHEFIIAADSLNSRLNSSFTSVINEFNRWRLSLHDSGMADNISYPPVQFESSVKGFYYKDPVIFENPLSIDEASVRGDFSRNSMQEPRVNFTQATVHNRDLQMEGAGTWRSDVNSDNGIVDLSGSLRAVSLPHLHNYLPNVMDPDAREWLKDAFQNGELSAAEFELKGVVDDFPFGLAPDSGSFLLRGTYADLLLNYHQKEIRGKRWPVVNSDSGTIHFKNDQIIIDSIQAFYTMPKGQRLDLDAFHGVVSSLEKNTTVDLQAKARGRAEDFLTFTRISPLGNLINNVLDEAQGSGQWTIPIELHIPVLDADNSRISGSIDLDDGRFRLTPDFPWAEHLDGEMPFTETQLQANAVKGVMLGGKVVFDGPIGTVGKPLSINGTLTAAGLRQLIPVQGMRRISGSADYTSLVHFSSGGRVKVQFKSDLAGLATRFPDGLSKPKSARWPATIIWRANDGARDNGKRYLDIRIDGIRTQAIFEHDVNSRKGPYFSRGTIGVNKVPELGQPGLTVLAQNPALDAQAWEDVVDEFTDSATTDRERQILPDVSHVTVQAQAFVVKNQTLTGATLAATKTGTQWNLQLNSDQAQGSGTWIPGTRSRDPGNLTVRLDTLNIIEPADERADTRTPLQKERDAAKARAGATQPLPRLDLSVKNLTVYGKQMGQMILKGYQLPGSDDWKVDYFSLVNEGGSLAGQGSIHQQGTAKDLQLQGKVVVSDLGRFLETYQLGGVIKNGNGQIDAEINWKNVQDLDLATLNGSLSGSLRQGRLESIQSSAVKALELLSLQSFRRLPKFGETLGNSVQSGLTFDTVRSRMRLDAGRLFVEDFRLNGPSSAIVASGMTDLQSESLDFQAVVVPKLDVSGASVLAGTIVNPAVGVGAFLTQWLLQAPLQRALTVKYHVTGNWAKPLLNDMALPSEAELKSRESERKMDELYRTH